MSRGASLCTIAHSQIESGICPWCKRPISKSGLLAEIDASERQSTRWNPVAIVEGLRSGDEWVRQSTIAGLSHGWKLNEEILGALGACVQDSGRVFGPRAEDALLWPAGNLTEAEAQMLERHAEGGPLELPARIMLLGYYDFGADKSPAAANAATRIRHVLWIIANAPLSEPAGSTYASIARDEHAEAYASGKAMWQQHVAAHPDSMQILKNAASFFWRDEPSLGIRILQYAISLWPHDALLKILLRGMEETRKLDGFREYDYWKDWTRDF